MRERRGARVPGAGREGGVGWVGWVEGVEKWIGALFFLKAF